jgi:DNA-binding transcriptional MerR regulator
MSIEINNRVYYTTKDLTEKFNVTNETIRDWRNNKGLKYTKISPKKIIYSEDDIEDFLKGKK